MLHRFRLVFQTGKKNKPLKSAFIGLANYNTDKNGYIHISNICIGMTEMNCAIDSLISELKEIRKQAKKKF